MIFPSLKISYLKLSKAVLYKFQNIIKWTVSETFESAFMKTLKLYIIFITDVSCSYYSIYIILYIYIIYIRINIICICIHTHTAIYKVKFFICIFSQIQINTGIEIDFRNKYICSLCFMLLFSLVFVVCLLGFEGVWM